VRSNAPAVRYVFGGGCAHTSIKHYDSVTIPVSNISYVVTGDSFIGLARIPRNSV